MKRIEGNRVLILSVVALISSLSFLGEQTDSKQQYERVVFKDPNWREETSVYDILSGGEVRGTGSFEIKPERLKGKKVYALMNKTVINGYTEATKVIIRAEDLKPILVEKSIVTNQGKVEVKAEYSGDVVQATLRSGENSQSMKVELPKDTYDNEEVLMMLRAFPFQDKNMKRFNTFSPSVGRTFLSEIKEVGREEVKAKTGIYDCRKLMLSAGGQTHYAWYGVSSPYYLVMYDNGRLVYRLNKIM